MLSWFRIARGMEADAPEFAVMFLAKVLDDLG